MTAKNALRIGAVAVLLFGACSEPEPGSRGDLEAQIEAIGLPSGMTDLGQRYTEDCAVSCPVLVAWYGTTGTVEEARSALFHAVEEAGWDVNEATASTELFAARKEDHILFVTTSEEMLARSPVAPEGAVGELSVNLLEDGPQP